MQRKALGKVITKGFRKENVIKKVNFTFMSYIKCHNVTCQVILCDNPKRYVFAYNILQIIRKRPLKNANSRGERRSAEK
jgi:hypothetical protein